MVRWIIGLWSRRTVGTLGLWRNYERGILPPMRRVPSDVIELVKIEGSNRPISRR